MKTTIELPDELFREAKATAARRGHSLKQFVREALDEKLARETRGAYPAREAAPEYAGSRSELKWPVPPPVGVPRAEFERIDQAIEDAFEQIDPEDWN